MGQRCSRGTPGPHVKLQRIETDFVGDTLKVMGLGRVGGDRGRKSCRSIRQAGPSTPLLEAKPQSGGGRGRSHAVGDAADIAISGQPFVTLMSELLMGRARLALVARHSTTPSPYMTPIGAILTHKFTPMLAAIVAVHAHAFCSASHRGWATGHSFLSHNSHVAPPHKIHHIV